MANILPETEVRGSLLLDIPRAEGIGCICLIYNLPAPFICPRSMVYVGIHMRAYGLVGLLLRIPQCRVPVQWYMQQLYSDR